MAERVARHRRELAALQKPTAAELQAAQDAHDAARR